MYESIISLYEKALFDAYSFQIVINHYLKKNDYGTIDLILNKTNWKSLENKNYIRYCATVLCPSYKKVKYKIFNLLFSQIKHEDEQIVNR